MNRKAVVAVALSGLVITSQCFQTGRSTSFGASQVCDVSSTTNWVVPAALTVLRTFQA